MPGAAANSLVTPASTGPAAGSGVTVTAQLRDANNNAVSLPMKALLWFTMVAVFVIGIYQGPFTQWAFDTAAKLLVAYQSRHPPGA